MITLAYVWSYCNRFLHFSSENIIQRKECMSHTLPINISISYNLKPDRVYVEYKIYDR